MKKKLLYGLMGIIFALSMVGFVACDDDDDDDSSGDGSTTTVEVVTNEDGSTTTTTTTTNTDGSSVSNAVTTDEDGNVTESTETLTDSDGETITSTTEYTYNEDGSTETTTTRTDSDGNTTATVETTASDGESTATVEFSTDCSVLLVSSDELEGATSITFTITSVKSSADAWGALYDSANWGGAIEWIFGYPLKEGAEITLGADNLLIWDDYVETGFYIGCGNNDDNAVTLTISYSISTASVTAYTKLVTEKSVTSATQILSASQIASASEIQLVIDGDALTAFYLIDGTGDGATSYSGLTTETGGRVHLTFNNDEGLTENLVNNWWLKTDENDDDSWVYVDLSSFQANGLWVSSADGVTVSAGYKKGDSSSADYSGYSSVDLSSVTLSSSAGVQVLSSSDLSSASEVVIIFTYDTTDDCWFNVLATSSLDSDSACKFDVGWQSAGTWTLTLTEDNIVLSRGTSYYWCISDDYSYTLSTYTSSGIYVAGGSSEGYGTVTLDAVYYK